MAKKGAKCTPEEHADHRRSSMQAAPEILASNKRLNKTLAETSGLDMSDVRGRRIMRPTITPSVRLKPHIGVIMADAYTVIAVEFRQLREKVECGQELSPSETRKFVQMADTMAKLAREEREQEKKTDPAQMSDEDLIMMMDDAVATLEKGD
jgi:hypothetical protein